MASIGKHSIDSLLSIAKRARNDNEKFAALLVISRVTKAEELNEKNKRDLFDTIGADFLVRLLRTAITDTTENNAAFASIGASVLCGFCSDETIAKRPEMSDVTTLLVQNIERLRRNLPDCKDALNDCIICLMTLCLHEVHVSKTLDNNGLAILCELERTEIKNPHPLIVRLLANHNEAWLCEKVVLKAYLKRLSVSFKDEQTMEKFSICERLLEIISTIPTCHNLALRTWTKDVTQGLQDILYSRVKYTQRTLALTLSSEMLRVCGSVRFFARADENQHFPIAVVRLSCIEVGMFFHDAGADGNIKPESVALLIACYAIIEAACSCIARFEENESENAMDDILTFEQIQMLQPALGEVAVCVGNFISERLLVTDADLPSGMQLCLGPSIRLLGSWMNIEYNLSSEVGRELFPVIPCCIKYIIDSGDVNLVRTVLPAVMKALDVAGLKAEVIAQVLPLANKLTTHALHCATTKSDPNSEVLQLTLQTVMGIVLSVTGEDITSHRQILEEMHSIVANALQSQCGIKTNAYLCSLSLILSNITGCDYDSPNNMERDAVKSAIIFLASCHSIPEVGKHLLVSNLYEDDWESVEPLWIICSQEAVKLARKQEWVCCMLKEAWKKGLPTIANAAKLSDKMDISDIFCNLLEVVETP